jgi:hypothetical protein
MGSERGGEYQRPCSLGEGTGSKESEDSEAPHRATASRLVPAHQPGRGIPGLLPEEFVAVLCPYCGERLETRVDLTADEPSYIEDCQVCCRPIEFSVERDDGGGLGAVRVQPVD